MSSLRQIVTLAAVAAVLAGCALPVRPNAGEPAEPPPVIMRARADAIVDQYLKTTNAANSRRTARPLAEVEAGASLKIDTAAIVVSRHANAQKSTLTPYTLVGNQMWIPRGLTYPKAFVVRGQVQALGTDGKPSGAPSQDAAIMVFRQGRAGAPWLQVYSLRVAGAVAAAVPAPIEHGTAFLPAGAEQEKELAVAPAALATAWAGQVSSGAAAAPKKGAESADELVAGEPFLDALDTSAAAFRKSVSKYFQVSDRAVVTGDPLVALRTRDGGALVFFSTVLSRQVRAKNPKGKQPWISVDGPFEALLGRDSASSLRVQWTQQWVALIPPKGKGPARVIGHMMGTTSVKDPRVP